LSAQTKAKMNGEKAKIVFAKKKILFKNITHNTMYPFIQHTDYICNRGKLFEILKNI
jgi:hypothetical protein